VLDGHQRLTALFVALGEGLVGAEGEDTAPAPNDGQAIDESWPIYFDLQAKIFERRRRRGALPDTWLPVSILFDPYKLYEFQKRLLDRGVDRALTNRAEALASTFKDYSVPVVPIVTEDLELATSSFQRVNRGGTKMTEVHMITALTWSPSFDLNDRMRDIRTELGAVGWQDLEDQMILNTCKSALDLDLYSANAKDVQKALRERPQVLEEATASLKKAATFLRDHCKIYGPAILPYSFQIVLLADALRLTTQPTPELDEALKKWFWLTTYTEHFAGISGFRFARTQEHIRRVVTQGDAPEPPDLVETVASPRRFDFRTARSRAMALRMADFQAEKGADQDPYQLLADFGGEAMPKLIPGRIIKDTDLSEGPWNRILVHPWEASLMRDFLQRQEFPEPELRALHFVDDTAIGLSDLLDRRRKALLRQEANFVESLGLTYEAA
jgi:hypothetical protein